MSCHTSLRETLPSKEADTQPLETGLKDLSLRERSQCTEECKLYKRLRSRETQTQQNPCKGEQVHSRVRAGRGCGVPDTFAVLIWGVVTAV